jgi:putative ABC transport system permease protein
MKYLPLIIRNLFRNKIRSLFTGSSIAVSLFLVVVLSSFLSAQEDIADRSKQYHRIGVVHVQGLTGSLPIAYVDRIRKMPGVRSAIPMSWFGGTYRDDKVPFAQFGTDPQYTFDVYEEMTVPPEQLKAWQDDRTGCIAGSLIARNKGWEIGDKIPLKGSIYPVNLELTLRGIYDGPETVDREMLWFHFQYMDEALKEKRDPSAGNAGIVMLRAQSASVMPTLMQSIEGTFASSDAPVDAMTEKEFGEQFMEMMGNIRGFIRYTSIAVVVALLCVAANTMAMALRERTREIALLKAIGFSQSSVLGMFLTESVLIGLLGGLLGALGAKLMFAVVDFSKFMTGMGWLYVPWSTALAGICLATLVGLLSGIIPAWQASRISVIDGLRKIV